MIETLIASIVFVIGIGIVHELMRRFGPGLRARREAARLAKARDVEAWRAEENAHFRQDDA